MSAMFNFFYLYDPWLFHFLRMSFLIGGMALLFLLYQGYKKSLKPIRLPMDSIIVLLALILFSAIPLMINGTKELGVIIMYIKSLLFFGIGIMIYHLFYAQENGKYQFIQDIKKGITLQFVIGVLALFSVPFIADIALGTNADYFLPRFRGSEQEYRLYNLTSSAFFQLSAFYLILLHFLLAYHHREKNAPLPSIYLFMLLCIGLISGRTFFIISLFSLLIYFRRGYILPLIFFFSLVLLLAITLPHNPYVAHALEPIINLLKVKATVGAENTTAMGNFMVSSSTDTLVKKHLFMPELKQFIMGDGLYYVDGNRYYGGSDSGFIRQVLYGGLGYVILCFLLTAYFVKRIAENWFNGSLTFILSTLFLLSVLNIKADTYAFPGIMFVLLMFLSLFGTSGKIFVFFNQKEK